MATANPIRNVSDTALWVAIYRAMESERPDAIFHDPYARRLGGERGQAIVDAMPQGASMSWPMVVRTAVMDEIVLRCVQQGATTVCSVDGNFIEVEDLLMHSILLLADGTRTQDELIAAVCAALPAPNKETETFQSILTTTVFEYLEDFREMGMLVSEGWPNA